MRGSCGAATVYTLALTCSDASAAATLDFVATWPTATASWLAVALRFHISGI
ncbi:MAG TPA: hypothetical protein PKZ97_18265 [Azospirillaceae bacterium]|nr:hypothetical protein [Azospirillaceae bacterium]